MTRKICVLFFGALALFLPTLCPALETIASIDFPTASIGITPEDKYHRVRLDGCDLNRKVGHPELPVRSVLVAVPFSATIEWIQVVSAESEEVRGDYRVYPVQPPHILPMIGAPERPVDFAQPNPTIYSSGEKYPPALATEGRTGNLLGYRVVALTLNPVQYVPSAGKLILHKRLDIRVKYRMGTASLSLPVERSEVAGKLCRETVASLVLNSRDVDFLAQSSEPVFTMLPQDEHEYVVITSAQFDSVFQRLADWKTKKGVPARVVTTDWIYSTYSGWDSAERIRNFVKDAHANWGTMWVLLGGDTNIIPDRVAFAMECEAGFHADEDSLRADHYYSDLDGSWDLNGNHIYGEVADSVDLYTDVFVARAPVENLSEAQTFVEKVLNYERYPVIGYQQDMAFLAEILWSFPYTDAGVFKDMIDEASVPGDFNITKLYQRDGNETKESVMAAINAGQSFINHAGHCSYTVMSVGEGALYNGDMDTLSNGSRMGLLYSIGCWPAAFDYDCIAEHFVNNPDGGGVAFIGNSRYGWGSPGNPGYGFSDMFDIEFFNQLFNEKVVKVGATLAATKAVFAPRSVVENVYRWHQYQLNVLGDPEMSVWTDSLRPLAVYYPDSVSVGESEFIITVLDGAGPVEGALVCLLKGEEVYERGLTNPAGQVSFRITPTTPGQMDITATALNSQPFEGSSTVFSTGPFVKYSGKRVADPSGNGDGVCNPGEVIRLGALVRNYGNQASSSLEGVIATSDPFLALNQVASSFGDLAAGDSALGSPDFEFAISAGCPDGHVAHLDLDLSDASGHEWSDVIAVTVCTPVITCPNYSVLDTAGNENGIPEPGETVTVLARLRNTGLGEARDVTAVLAGNAPYISVPGSLATIGDIGGGKEGWARFTVRVDGACPVPYFSWLSVEVATSESWSFSDSILFVVGALGFEDDVENGAGDWVSEGAWHITEHRSHSTSHSWYCGHEDVWQYDNQMNISLTGPWFVVGPSAYLSFWHWYDMPIYGSDGLYIEIYAGSGWELIDFKGCGGALDSLLPGRMWFSEWYDLSSYQVGDSARVRFRFFSDLSDVGEGWYVDDINVGAVVTGAQEERKTKLRPGRPELYQNRPNPFKAATTVYAFNPLDLELTLEIYDVAGRLVNRLPMLKAGNGMIAATWDGTTPEGSASSIGTYFYRLTPSLGTTPRKMILLR